MSTLVDETDRRILARLQRDASKSMESVAEAVHLSRNACWRRIKRLESEGVIRGRVALVAPEAVGLGLTVFIMVRTSSHDPGWLKRFRAAVRETPEIIGAHRMSGDLDYVLRMRVGSVRDYDAAYQRLIAKIPIADVSASFVMEDIKDETALPL